MTLPPGSTIGILGGGQLGRMLALAAARMGFKVHVFDPAPDGPAQQVSHRATIAAYDDHEALQQFATAVDIVTYEFENVPTTALDVIEAIVSIHPGRLALATSQDRILEKTYLQGIGLPVAPFAAVEDASSLNTALEAIGTPAILKTRRFGYDGKGQARIQSPDVAIAALSSLNGAPAVLEGFVSFDTEISVIGARNATGQVVCFDPGQNMHSDGILDTTEVPAHLPQSMLLDAVLMTGKLLNALEYIGVIGVEFFVTQTGLIVNEFAPRVHNSGHWTQDACAVDQFEQHIRAIAGWPLGDGIRHANAQMTNLIGHSSDQWERIASDPDARLHLYGKAEAHPGRKMGHVNRITPMG